MTPVNKLYNSFQFIKYVFTPSYVKRLLEKNGSLYNSHTGEICYIIGNGPSLKQMYDLSVLKDRFVITVNTIMRSEVFDKVNSNFHVLMDPVLFNGNASKEDVNSFSKLDGRDILIPYNYFKSAKEIWPKSNLWCCYNSYIPLEGSMHADFTKPIYSFNNVLHWALLWAMYMGFSNIVILGADMTGFMEPYYNKNNMSTHVYDYSVKERTQTVLNSNEWYLKAYGQTLEFFRYLHDIAMKKQIDIVNATPMSFLDVFPMVNFNETLK